MARLSKQGVTTIGTGIVLLPLLEGVAHLGPTGLFLAGCGTLIAYRHGTQIVDGGATLADKLVVTPKGRTFTEKMLGLNKEADYQDAGAGASDLSILIGFNRQNKEVRKSMQHLKSILILGAAGMGKSSTACFLLGQMIEQGARISIIDKHARSDESLSAMLSPFEAAFTHSPAYQPDTAQVVAKYASDELSGRIEGTRSCANPYILTIDEFSDIMRQATQAGPWTKAAQALVAIIEEIITGGRKYNCFVLCMGQIVNASRTGGTEIRELFNTRVIHGMKESQAAMILSKQFRNQCANLEPGQIILDIEGKDDPFFVQIPQMAKQDIARIASSIKPVAMGALDLPDLLTGDEDEEETTDFEMVPIGKDNRTKEDVLLPKQTLDMLIKMRKAGKLAGFREIQNFLDCSETHARNINRLVDAGRDS